MTDDISKRQPETVGLTDVDCTPRPRWRESQLAFEARMRRLGADREALERTVKRDNRISSVRPVPQPDGTLLHVAFCVCGFHGLQVADAEVARREYDAHACTANDGDAIHRVYRGPIDKRPPSTLIPALAEERAKLGITLPGETDVAPVAQTSTLDEFEQRVKLLETK